MELSHRIKGQRGEKVESGTSEEIINKAKGIIKSSSLPFQQRITLTKETKNENNNDSQDILDIHSNMFGHLVYEVQLGLWAQKIPQYRTTIKELTRDGGILDRFKEGTLTQNEKNVTNNNVSQEGGRRKKSRRTRRRTSRKLKTRKH